MPSHSRSPSPLPHIKTERVKREAEDTTSPRRTTGRQQWTDEEEEIWRECVKNVLHKHLFAEIRADGRLETRKGGLTAHLKAYLKKL